MNGFSLQIRKRREDKELYYWILDIGHFPMNPLEFPREDAVNTALWKLIPIPSLAPFHQESWWFMSTTANQGTICLRQFLFSHLSLSLSHKYCTVYNDLCPVQSAKWRLLSLTPPGRLAFAVKQQCRPLAWRMVLDDKKILGLYIQSLKS